MKERDLQHRLLAAASCGDFAHVVGLCERATFSKWPHAELTNLLKSCASRGGQSMLEHVADAIGPLADATPYDKALVAAARAGNRPAARFLLSKGARARADLEGDGALELALRATDPDMVVLLLSRGRRETDGRLALHVAAARKDVETVSRLIDAGIADAAAEARAFEALPNRAAAPEFFCARAGRPLRGPHRRALRRP